MQSAAIYTTGRRTWSSLSFARDQLLLQAGLDLARSTRIPMLRDTLAIDPPVCTWLKAGRHTRRRMSLRGP
jgi:hypothetical protein